MNHDELIDMCTRIAFDEFIKNGGKGLRTAMVMSYQHMITWHNKQLEDKEEVQKILNVKPKRRK